MDIVVPRDNENPVVPIMHHNTEATYLDKDDPILNWCMADSLHSDIDICSLMSFYDLPINAPKDTLPEAFMYLNTHTKSNNDHSEADHEGNPTTAPKPVLMTYVGSSRSETKKSETISVSL